MANLILVRHSESVWNAKDLWTGLTDVDLSPKGEEEARKIGKFLTPYKIQIAFTSELKRAQQTLEEILKVLGIEHIPIYESIALNERNYGDFTGKNKWDLQKEYGNEQFLKWRRGWDEKIPNGETLKDVYERVVPYFKEHIFPKLKANKNVLISAHGNSLRALIKYLEHISDDAIPKFEMETGEVFIYDINSDGEIISKEIMTSD